MTGYMATSKTHQDEVTLAWAANLTHQLTDDLRVSAVMQQRFRHSPQFGIGVTGSINDKFI